MRNSGFTILLIAILISLIGILSIYSSTYQKENKQLQDTSKRQVAWVMLGVLVFLGISNLNYRRFWDATYFLYAFTVFLLLMVLTFGAVRLGAQRWLKIMWFSFQPSEIAKLSVLLFLARYFSTKSVRDVFLPAAKLKMFKALIIPFAFLIFPIALIVEQPDLGSGATLFIIFILMLYFSGIKLKYILFFLSAIVCSLPILWFFLLRDYQKERLFVFVNPNIDPLGAGYTVIQSKIAIGSGGFFGRGWLAGTQSQLQFLPESHTDFIFATFAEQWGFFGCVILLFLYFLLIRYGLMIANHSKDGFARLLAFGITAMLGVQIFINIAMNMGLAPVVGLPLPLMSYGGSSTIVTYLSLGILANINKTRAVF